MGQDSSTHLPSNNNGGLPSKLKSAMSLLIDGHHYALDLERELWNFPVEIETLAQVGLQPNDFRWLVGKGYVEPGCETTRPCSEHREFSLCRTHSFNERSCNGRACFILTDAGLAYARKILNGHGSNSDDEDSLNSDCQNENAAKLLPNWDVELREFHCNGRIIKRFRSRAPNQEAILSAFQEEGWRPHIDDPMPQNPDREQTPQRRLNDAVKGLNRHQQAQLVHFSTDGTGEGVRWEWTESDSEAST